jgi:60S ribosomal protein uL30
LRRERPSLLTPRSTTTSTRPPPLESLRQRETLKPLETSSCPLRPRLPSQSEPEGKFILPLRINILWIYLVLIADFSFSINKLSPVCKKILILLRLRQLHNGVFVKLNKATVNMLRRVEPYIVYGYLTQKNISKLIYKRGYGKVNGSRIPLTDNQIVENSLGKRGISSVEDLIHEIVTVGPNFKQANNFLWPFKLSSPKKGFAKKRHPYQNGGVWGNREEQLNELVTRML